MLKTTRTYVTRIMNHSQVRGDLGFVAISISRKRIKEHKRCDFVADRIRRVAGSRRRTAH